MQRTITTTEIHGVTSNATVGTAIVKKVEAGDEIRLYWKEAPRWKFGKRYKNRDWNPLNGHDYWSVRSDLSCGRSRLLDRRTNA